MLRTLLLRKEYEEAMLDEHPPNDSWVRTKRGKQHYYKRRKQIRYINIFNIINFLTLLSADAKSAILLRVPSLTKVLIFFSNFSPKC